MKLLLDENLSRRLVPPIADLFPGSTHVAFEGLLQVPDTEVWQYANAGGYMATALGPPPKVIWLRDCDYPTAVAERLIRGQAIRITEFLQDEEEAVLVLSSPRY